MQPLTIIFTGRSGAGKGTQAALLKTYLEEKMKQAVFHLESGARFREFIKGSAYSNTLSAGIYRKEELQPEFLSIWIWADLLVGNVTKDNHLIFDGVPRRLSEAQVLESAFDFYERKKVVCIDFEISTETSLKRLRMRGRIDDKTDEDILKREAWYETDVVPVIDRFKSDARYSYMRINGEETPEQIHADVLRILGLEA